MDRQTTYSLDLWGEQKSEVSAGQESNNQVQKKLVDFILSFAVDNAFIYRYDVFLSWLSTCCLTPLQRPDPRKRLVKTVLLRRRHLTSHSVRRRAGAKVEQ